MKIKSLFKNISIKYCLIIILGVLIQTLGVYNIHSISGVTEGGVLGLLLLFNHWFSISPAITSIVLNGICYFIGYKVLGKDFIFYSVLAIVSFSIMYSIVELFPPIYPEIANFPLIAAILGGLCIGVGAGLTVKYGGASSGDDAIAMTISKKFNIKIQTVYLFSDLTVMLLSLTYIPFSKIIYSLLTVILSGQIIGLIVGKEDNANDKEENDTKDKNESDDGETVDSEVVESKNDVTGKIVQIDNENKNNNKNGIKTENK